jgi:hypothetical protein
MIGGFSLAGIELNGGEIGPRKIPTTQLIRHFKQFVAPIRRQSFFYADLSERRSLDDSLTTMMLSQKYAECPVCINSRTLSSSALVECQA